MARGVQRFAVLCNVTVSKYQELKASSNIMPA
jgi:hypothetical protein